MENGASGSSYTPKNILITGGAGFIGSHVVLRLVKNYGQYKVGHMCISGPGILAHCVE